MKPIQQSSVTRRTSSLVAAFVVLATGACVGTPPDSNGVATAAANSSGQPTLRVQVSIAPQAELVERLAGGRARVAVLLPNNASEETFAPSPRQLAALTDSDLYFAIGHPAFSFEPRFVDPFLANHPAIARVDMVDGIELLELHSDGHAHELPPSSGAATPTTPDVSSDPHVWLSVDNLVVATRNLATALTRLDPEGAVIYGTNLAALELELSAVKERIRNRLSPFRGRPFLAAHASWGYFAAEAGLRQIAIDSGGKEPGAARLVALAAEARSAGITVIVTQPGFSTKSAQALAEATGATLIELDPLRRDVVANIEMIAEALANGFASRGTGAHPPP